MTFGTVPLADVEGLVIVPFVLPKIGNFPSIFLIKPNQLSTIKNMMKHSCPLDTNLGPPMFRHFGLASNFTIFIF